MCGHTAMLALAAGLSLIGTAGAVEQGPMATGSITAAISSGKLGHKDSGTAGFGFSPFLEEGLVSEVPQARHHQSQKPVPAYLRDLREVID